MSIDSVLKPPKSGNCSVENNKPSQNLITLDSIKQIYKSCDKNQSSLQIIHDRLDFAIEQEFWSLDDTVKVSDHDCYLSPVIDCILYYVTGYLSKQIIRFFKCTTCQAAIKQPYLNSVESDTQLTNLTSRGELIHPNLHFFNFVCKIEQLFIKYCLIADVFELILTGLLENNVLYFPCFCHSKEIIAFTIRYYINMRMRQFSKKCYAEIKKENMIKKKKFQNLH